VLLVQVTPEFELTAAAVESLAIVTNDNKVIGVYVLENIPCPVILPCPVKVIAIIFPIVVCT
jgi:hypothetical protein